MSERRGAMGTHPPAEILETEMAEAARNAQKALGLPVTDTAAEVAVTERGHLVMPFGGPTHLAIVAACRQWLINHGIDPDA
jgi:hypothetical protein